MKNPAENHETGLGLIEVIVAIFLLAILAVVMLPAVMGMINVSAKNSLLATANQGVNQMLERARNAGSTCAALIPPAPLPPLLPQSAVITTAAGAKIEIDTAVVCNPSSASTTAPGVATISSIAYRPTDPSDVLASGQTSVVVTG
ncbi:type II secretion system protein [Gryllotalpicola protaetiae]|uniref:Type II secretion system protein n=1 Tax=Gryllotalpicola protaetiae TaxID=2419771 RepID=A0A387BPR8_9MICO|nr:type II secretion system protein [Gryllotalpicola protaetiae]AYG03007.1 type II secretion system protein [Gryllotalpicola protaetiae]